MKTQILHIEAHDDAVSTRDKLGWKQTGRVLLVFPERGRVLARPLDLLLIQRHASRLGAQIALVTHDPLVKLHAAEIGLPVFGSAEQAQRVPWRRGWRRLRLPQSRRSVNDLLRQREAVHPAQAGWQLPLALRMAVFLLGALAVAALVGLFVPSAQIVLTPQTRTQSITIPVQANPGNDARINLSGSVPLRNQRILVEGRLDQATSGSILLPLENAGGMVSLRNLTSEALAIPGDLILASANGQRFAVQRSGALPAFGELNLPVRALQPGLEGNLPAAEALTIEGSLGVLVSAASAGTFSGGTQARVPAPSQADIERLTARLQDSLIRTAEADLAALLQPGDLYVPASQPQVRLLSAEQSAQTGQPANEISLTLRLEVTLNYLAASDLETLARGVLDANLPPGYLTGDSAIEWQIEPASQPGTWTLQASRALLPEIDAQQLAERLRGLPPAQAIDLLGRQVPLAQAPQISLVPAQWPWLPWLPMRMQWHVDAPES